MKSSLKSTLCVFEPSGRETEDGEASLLRGVNKSKSQSLWAFDVEAESPSTASLASDKLLRNLNDRLQNAFRKDSKAISETLFDRMAEQFQQDVGRDRSEMACLLLMEDRLTDLTQIVREDFKLFVYLFSNILEGRIAKLRKKEKSAQLSNFDNIVQSTFRKKPLEKTYFEMEEKPRQTSREGAMKQRGRREEREIGKREELLSPKASCSASKKLNRLFSKDKKSMKQKVQNDSIRNDDDEPANATAVVSHDESISFSAALGANVTVRARRRKPSPEKKEKTRKQSASEKEGDEAFMFFRPKKSKR